MTVTVKHAKTNAISDWTQAQLDEQIALGNFAEGTVLADIVLPSDWNDDHTLTGLGTMAEQDANSVAITDGTATLSSVTTPSVTATTNDLTLSAISTGNVNLATLGGTQFKAIEATGSVNVWNVRGGDGSTTNPRFTTEGTGTNIAGQFNTKGTGALQFFSGNTEQMRITNTASAVNYVQVTGAATGGNPTISMQGSDTNISTGYISKGTGQHIFASNGTINNQQFRILNTASTVNYPTVTGSVTTNAIPFSVAGTDTNISMVFQPKGTGAIDLAAGSSGVNISNGGTVTAITRTNAGAGYTSVPTITISPPTTAGGTTATATVTSMGINFVTIVSGGTGYAVNDEILISGGTFTTQARYRITAVSAGVVTTLTPIVTPNYQALPTNPASTTTAIGTGSGLTLTVNWAVTGQSFTAGSGYVEQPTVTITGGGGSGAAAYATVGSTTVIKTLGSVANSSGFSFQTPAGEQLRISDAGNTSVNYLAMWGNATGAAPRFVARGSDTDVSLIYSTKGAGTHTFRTNDTNQTQFQISHTASAVNYVQVTGAATGGAPAISPQGSDANIQLNFSGKGNGQVVARSWFTAAQASANYWQMAGASAGSSPTLSVLGSDTNIDLALTPKGTGVVQFGTHTANADVAISGYITIKDSGGTLRKLAVIT